MSNVATETEERERRMALQGIRKHMLNFGNQIHEYFEHTQADVEDYKFIVEKHGDGVEIEILFKAYVHPKSLHEAARIIPK